MSDGWGTIVEPVKGGQFKKFEDDDDFTMVYLRTEQIQSNFPKKDKDGKEIPGTFGTQNVHVFLKDGEEVTFYGASHLDAQLANRDAIAYGDTLRILKTGRLAKNFGKGNAHEFRVGNLTKAGIAPQAAAPAPAPAAGGIDVMDKLTELANASADNSEFKRQAFGLEGLSDDLYARIGNGTLFAALKG